MPRIPKTEAVRSNMTEASKPEHVINTIKRLMDSLSEEDRAVVAQELVKIEYGEYTNGHICTENPVLVRQFTKFEPMTKKSSLLSTLSLTLALNLGLATTATATAKCTGNEVLKLYDASSSVVREVSITFGKNLSTCIFGNSKVYFLKSSQASKQEAMQIGAHLYRKRLVKNYRVGPGFEY